MGEPTSTDTSAPTHVLSERKMIEFSCLGNRFLIIKNQAFAGGGHRHRWCRGGVFGRSAPPHRPSVFGAVACSHSATAPDGHPQRHNTKWAPPPVPQCHSATAPNTVPVLRLRRSWLQPRLGFFNMISVQLENILWFSKPESY